MMCAKPSRCDSLRVVFWNVENLFDAVDDSGIGDDDYTPEGALHWTHSRYYDKLIRLSRVIGDMSTSGVSPSIIGLAEVENDSVLDYWTHHTPMKYLDYRYLRASGGDARGINVALLYNNYDFRLCGSEAMNVVLPPQSRKTRSLLHAWGTVVSGDTLDVVVVHLPSRYGGIKESDPSREAVQKQLRHLADSLLSVRMRPSLIIMGDMNDKPDSKSLIRNMQLLDPDSADKDTAGLYSMMLPLERKLHNPNAVGTHKYHGRWSILDQIFVNGRMLRHQPQYLSPAITVADVIIFHMPYMMCEDAGYLGNRPLRSYYGHQYEGGFSDHFPVVIDVLINR